MTRLGRAGGGEGASGGLAARGIGAGCAEATTTGAADAGRTPGMTGSIGPITEPGTGSLERLGATMGARVTAAGRASGALDLPRSL